MGNAGTKESKDAHCERFCCAHRQEETGVADPHAPIKRLLHSLQCAFGKHTLGLQVGGWCGTDPTELILIRAHLLVSLLPYCQPPPLGESSAKTNAYVVVSCGAVRILMQAMANSNVLVQLPAAIALAMLTWRPTSTQKPHQAVECAGDCDQPHLHPRALDETEAPDTQRGVPVAVVQLLAGNNFQQILCYTKQCTEPALAAEQTSDAEFRDDRGQWTEQGELLKRLGLEWTEPFVSKMLVRGALPHALLALLANLVEQEPTLAPEIVTSNSWCLYHCRQLRRTLRQSLHPLQIADPSLVPPELLLRSQWDGQCPIPSIFCNQSALRDLARILVRLENASWAGGYSGSTSQVHAIVALCLDYRNQQLLFAPREISEPIYVSKEDTRAILKNRTSAELVSPDAVMTYCEEIMFGFRMTSDQRSFFVNEVRSRIHPTKWPPLKLDLDEFLQLCEAATLVIE